MRCSYCTATPSWRLARRVDRVTALICDEHLGSAAADLRGPVGTELTLTTVGLNHE